MRSIAVGLALIALVGVGGAGCGGSDEKAGSPAEQRCVDVWNDPSNTTIRNRKGGDPISRASMSAWGKYMDISVGFASGYPDRCLITIAAPENATALQFIEEEAPLTGFAVAGHGPAMRKYLVARVTERSAEANADGTISLR